MRNPENAKFHEMMAEVVMSLDRTDHMKIIDYTHTRTQTEKNVNLSTLFFTFSMSFPLFIATYIPEMMKMMIQKMNNDPK